jgi:uncharacterized protein YndB with AHSA1/START domain
MGTVTVSIEIAAPPEQVFDAVAHIESFQQVVEDIVNVEFVSEVRRGVGARFRETRTMKGRQATSTLEVTEYEPPSHVRLVSDEGGSVWDSVFRVAPKGEGSVVPQGFVDNSWCLFRPRGPGSA